MERFGLRGQGHHSPIPDLVVVPELSDGLPIEQISPGMLSIPGTTFLTSRSSGSSARASSITSSIFDMSYETEQLEKALRENDTYSIQKILQLHRAKFPLDFQSICSNFDKSLSCESRSRRASRCVSNASSSRRESVATEYGDNPIIFKNSMHIAIKHNALEAAKLLLQYGIDPNSPTINIIPPPTTGIYGNEIVTINVQGPSQDYVNIDTTNKLCLHHRQCRSGLSFSAISEHSNNSSYSDDGRASSVVSGSLTRQGSAGINSSIRCRRQNACLSATQVPEIIPEKSIDLSSIYTQEELYSLPPVYLAVLQGRPSFVTLLLQHGAEPDICDRHGYTPLHVAVSRDHSNSANSCIRELLLYGAKIFAKDFEGITPADLCIGITQQQQGLIHQVLSGKYVMSLTEAVYAGANSTCLADHQIQAETTSSTGGSVHRLLRKFNSNDNKGSKNKKINKHGVSGMDIFQEMRDRVSSVSSAKSVRSKLQSVIAEDLDSDTSLVSSCSFLQDIKFIKTVIEMSRVLNYFYL